MLEKAQPTLEEVQQQFEGWRRHRGRRERIPPALWEAAASLSEQHSVYQISKRLHLHYGEQQKVGGLAFKRCLKSGQDGFTPPVERPSYSFQLAPRGVNLDQKLENAVKTMDSNQAPDFLLLSDKAILLSDSLWENRALGCENTPHHRAGDRPVPPDDFTGGHG